MIVKVCGMSDAVNIRLAEQLNIDWMGFIFYPPSPRYVERRPDYLPQRQQRVGVFVNADEDFILSRISLFGLQLLQLHGHETPQQCRALREISGLPLIKAFSVRSAADVALTRHYEGAADYFLFDTPTPGVGGSGRSFDHSLLDHYTGATPFLLSGGLGPDSVSHILALHHPQMVGIDLNSRFETAPGIKSIHRLQQFLQTLGQAAL